MSHKDSKVHRYVVHGHSPQVIVTLAPNGGLQAELPGSPNGQRRVVPLKADCIATSLKMMLEDQAKGNYEIGSDGAPTQAQVRHWERHCFPEMAIADPRCRFCIAEGRLAAPGAKRRQRREIIVKTKDMQISRIPAAPQGRKGEPQNQRSNKTAEELDL